MSVRGCVDHPGHLPALGAGLDQPGHEQVGEEEVAEVVHGHLALQAVLCLVVGRVHYFSCMGTKNKAFRLISLIGD